MFIKVKCRSSETWCGQTKSDLDFRELPIFSYKNLVDKEEIGVGAFAVVFRAKLTDESKVVVKNLISADKETKKSLIKEARFLQNLRDANVVEFKGICTDQLSLLLEYAYFDFSPFGCDIQTHSLAEFLAVCEQSSCDGMNVAVLTHAAFDVASGLKYLHQNNHVLPSYPRFTLSSAFYSNIRVLPSRPSDRPDIRPSIRPDIRLDIRPYPRFTLTLTRPPFVNLLYVNNGLVTSPYLIICK